MPELTLLCFYCFQRLDMGLLHLPQMYAVPLKTMEYFHASAQLALCGKCG